MNKILGIWLFCLAFLTAGCFEKTDPAGGATNEIDADTAVAASAPIVEIADTTLQPVQQLTLTAIGNTLEEIAYKEDTLYAQAGALVKLSLVNEGIDMPMVHNVVITKPGKYKEVALGGAEVGAPGNYVPESPEVIAASTMALPGQTVEMEFTAPAEPGSYDFVCTYPGHWKKMNGVFIIK
ncbi:plastocyanin/azurin family copper-binding protein [Pontibacter locisalis]|uniref:Plastocyanin/azurin family copper-binding protein n=1 Tax=Pontibacter locisalis TaxID=1719035 RepID=A0ABW5IQF4_9BACT